MSTANVSINPHTLDIDNELLYVDRTRHSSGRLRNATPLFARAILGNTIVIANVAELDDESIRIWYKHHRMTADMPEVILRTMCSLHTLHVECEGARALINTQHQSRDPLFPEQ